MKKLFIILVITLMTSAVSFAQSTRYQRGYVKKNGTYVSGHYKTQSDRTNQNNFSTISNTNPYTGSRGSRAKDYSSGAYNYGRGKTVHTGNRGGQYYYNSKTFVQRAKLRSLLFLFIFSVLEKKFEKSFQNEVTFFGNLSLKGKQSQTNNKFNNLKHK